MLAWFFILSSMDGRLDQKLVAFRVIFCVERLEHAWFLLLLCSLGHHVWWLVYLIVPSWYGGLIVAKTLQVNSLKWFVNSTLDRRASVNGVCNCSVQRLSVQPRLHWCIELMPINSIRLHVPLECDLIVWILFWQPHIRVYLDIRWLVGQILANISFVNPTSIQALFGAHNSIHNCFTTNK